MSNSDSNPLTKNTALTNILFSSIAAVITRLATHPLDTVKTVIQYNTPSQTIPSTASTGEIRRTFQLLTQSHSLTSLYRGLSIALVFSVPALTVYLSTYDAAKDRIAKWGGLGGADSILVHGSAGAIAEAMSGVFWTPMEVVKNKLQVGVGADGVKRHVGYDAVPAGKGVREARRTGETMRLVGEIYRNEGIRGFFKGYLLSLGVFIPYTMTYFILYEDSKSRFACFLSPSTPSTPANPQNPTQLPFGIYLLCAAWSGAVAGAVSNVMDVVKTRVQTSGQVSGSAFTLMKDMWMNEGKWRAFLRGAGARCLWTVPSVSISFTTYEILKDRRDHSNN